MKKLTQYLLFGFFLALLAFAMDAGYSEFGFIAFLGFFGMPESPETNTADNSEAKGIKKLANEIYFLYCDWRKHMKEASLLKRQNKELLSNNSEFESSEFRSQTIKTKKQLQLVLWTLGAVSVDFFLLQDAFLEKIGKNTAIPSSLIIAFTSVVILGLEIAISSFLDSQKRKQENASDQGESKLKYILVAIVPMIAVYSFYNDYANNDGGSGSIFFFASLTLLSMFTHFIAIKNADEYMSLIGYMQVNNEMNKLKKKFEAIPQKIIDTEHEIDKKLGILFNMIVNYQQRYPDDNTNFLQIIPNDLRAYFNHVMGTPNGMPLSAGYVPSGGWLNSFLDFMQQHSKRDVEVGANRTLNSTEANNRANNTDVTADDSAEENEVAEDAFSNFFGGGGEKQV